MSFKLSATLGRRVTFGETVDLALTALERVDTVSVPGPVEHTMKYMRWSEYIAGRDAESVANHEEETG
jgi:hypothetical protein